MLRRFEDRREAGRYLGKALKHYAHRPEVLALALPRGGVPVGFEVAAHLNVPLDVFLVRKIGVPGHDEYAMGAMASGGVILLNEEVVRQLNISQSEIERVIEREERELKRREGLYKTSEQPVELKGRVVILIDDGLATGSTMKVAVAAVQKKQPGKVVVAVPVAPASTAAEFEELADEFVCVLRPEMFSAVGEWYVDFDQTSDSEVRSLLRKAAENFQAGFPILHSPLI